MPIFIAIAFGTQKVFVEYYFNFAETIFCQDLMRAWISWLPHRPYGSITFTHTGSGSTTRGGTLSTNVYTSQGVVTDSSATATVSEAQSQLQKPVVITGVPLERLAAGSLRPEVPGVIGKLCIVPPHIEHTVHFELQERSQSQASALEQRLGVGT